MNYKKTKVAIVTGASRGIGKAIALGMAKSGYQLVLISRKHTDLEDVSNKIKKAGGLKPEIFAVDITHQEEVEKMISEVMLKFMRIDVLVNNAGIHFGGTLELPLHDFKLMMDTNLTAQFMILQLVVPIMKQQQAGYIFNVASRSGKVGFPGTGGYCASKFGLVGMTESLYRELSPFGIKVTALCPAWVNTDMARQSGTALKAEDMIQPDDIYETIKWLLKLSPGTCVKEVVLTNPKSQ